MDEINNKVLERLMEKYPHADGVRTTADVARRLAEERQRLIREREDANQQKDKFIQR